MNQDLRWGVTSMVVTAALLLGNDWGDRIGLFFLIMAFIVTIDMTGEEK